MIDASSEIQEGFHVKAAVGDVPDYYYRLHLPSEMARHFCLSSVTPKEVAEELRRLGAPVEFDESKEFLAVRALVMGFSWAVYLAQITLEDSLASGVSWVSAANQLAQGRPVPPLTRSTPVHWDTSTTTGC